MGPGLGLALTRNVSGSAESYLLGLTLSSASIVETAAAGALVGYLERGAAGSVLTLVDDAGGRFALGAATIVLGTTAVDHESATTHVITVRETLAAAVNSPRDSQMTIVVTNANDTDPAPFNFTDQVGVAVSTVLTSDEITVSGLGAADEAVVSIAGGSYSKNGGAFTSLATTAANGDTFRVRHTSSATGGDETHTLLTIGQVSDAFTTTTLSSSLISNGNFSSSAGWTLGGSAEITGGQLVVTTSSTVSHDTNAPLIPGNYYVLTFDVVAISVGSINTFTLGGGDPLMGFFVSTTGAKTVYLKAGETNQTLSFTGHNATIDNVSLLPASASLSTEYVQNGGFDDGAGWSLSAGVSIAGGTVNWSTSPSFRMATPTLSSAIEASGYYLVEYEITAHTAGVIFAVVGGQNGTLRNSVGVYSQLIFAGSTDAPFIRSSSVSTTVSLDNFSIKKVTFS